jgi:glycosyltransferase 2 family protein
VFAVILFFFFSVAADWKSVLNSFSHFNLLLIPILLLLSFGNYIIRFVKWDYYLRLLKIKIDMKLSFRIFISGLAMSASPAKSGEVLKSLLLKETTNEPVSKTAPIIFAERLTDFFSLTFLSLIGALYYHYAAIWIYAVLFFFVITIFILSNRPIAEFIILKLIRIPRLKSQISRIETLYESVYILLQPKPLLLMLIVSVISWFFECFGFYIIVCNFSENVPVLWTTFVYAASTIAGAVSMLPGGLGITEGSLSLFLIHGGMPKVTAVASTFIIRVMTLWFAVIVGMVVLFLSRKVFNYSLNKNQE